MKLRNGKKVQSIDTKKKGEPAKKTTLKSVKKTSKKSVKKMPRADVLELRRLRKKYSHLFIRSQKKGLKSSFKSTQNLKSNKRVQFRDKKTPKSTKKTLYSDSEESIDEDLPNDYDYTDGWLVLEKKQPYTSQQDTDDDILFEINEQYSKVKDQGSKYTSSGLRHSQRTLNLPDKYIDPNYTKLMLDNLAVEDIFSEVDSLGGSSGSDYSEPEGSSSDGSESEDSDTETSE